MKRVLSILLGLVFASTAFAQAVVSSLSILDNEPLEYVSGDITNDDPTYGPCAGYYYDDAYVNSYYAITIYVVNNGYEGYVSIPYSSFEYDWDYCRWEYNLSSPISINGSNSQHQTRRVAVLNNLFVGFKLKLPYEIRYSYSAVLDEIPDGFGTPRTPDTGLIYIIPSDVIIPYGRYEARCRTTHGGTDTNGDGFQNNAIGQEANDPSGENSMEYFYVDSETDRLFFERGFAWLSCEDDSMMYSIQSPSYPDYSEILDSSIFMFGIYNVLETSCGDNISGTEVFNLMRRLMVDASAYDCLTLEPMQGVTIHGLPGDPQTDENGRVLVTVEYGWSSPGIFPTTSDTCDYFVPTSAGPIENLTVDLVDSLNFCRLKYLFEITGRVTDESNNGIGEVWMDGLGHPTDMDGYYYGGITSIIECGWTITVTPIKEGYSFTPQSRYYENIHENYVNQDYVGTQE